MALVMFGTAVIGTSARADDCGDGDGAGGSYACGHLAETHGDYTNSAFGNFSAISGGAGNTAIGTSASAGAFDDNGNTAVGYASDAKKSSTALGRGANAYFANSMALGRDVATSADNQVAIGSATNTYTLAGLDSAASRTAQVGPIHLVTTDANGNVATSTFDVATLEDISTTVEQNSTDISNLQTTVAGHTTELATHTTELATHTTELADHETRITNNALQIVNLDTRVTTNTSNIAINTNNIAILDNRVDMLEANFQDLGNEISETRSEARSGTALALATAGLRYDDRPEKLSLAGGYGYFKGENGFALGLGYNPDVDVRLNAAFSAAPGQGNVGVSVGASWTLN
jgi:autotransporter adhesin